MSENRFDPVAHAGAMRASGLWLDKSFDEFLQQTIAATPGKLALIADRADRSEPRRLTSRSSALGGVRELDTWVDPSHRQPRACAPAWPAPDERLAGQTKV